MFCSQCGTKISPREPINIDWDKWVPIIIVTILVIVFGSLIGWAVMNSGYERLPSEWKIVYSAITLMGNEEGRYKVFKDINLDGMPPLGAGGVEAIASLFGTSECRQQVLRVLMK